MITMLFTGFTLLKYRMGSYIFAMVLFVFCVTSALEVDLQETGLMGVPQDINPLVSDLDLDENDINRITRTTFALYKELRKLSLRHTGLKYVEDGSFDHNTKLEELSLRKNRIVQFPRSFGPAAPSLILLDLWSAIDDETLHVLNFEEMIRLETLYLGDLKFPGTFDAALLPPTSQYINLNRADLTQFSDFQRYTPNMNILGLGYNDIMRVPSKSIAGLSALKELFLQNNKLSTIPDLYHLPLERLKLGDNPLACNQSHGWIRMWPWVKTTDLKTDDITCITTGLLDPVLLTDINPVTLGCHYGGHC